MKNKIHIALDSFFIEKDSQKSQIDFLEKNKIDYEFYRIVPFSHEIIPPLPKDKIIIPFGCIEFVQAILKNKEIDSRIIFDDIIFTNENCLNQWKSFCLNNNARIVSAKQIIDTFEEDEYFMRPIDDKKSFTGGVFKPSQIKKLMERYVGYENNEFKEDSKVIVSKIKNIKREWRNIVIDGKIISSSLYRENGVHIEKMGIPPDVEAFCRAALFVYNPAKAFVLDVCELEDGSFAIVEFGCIHNCGFYQSDMPKVMEAFIEFIYKM